MLAEECCLYLVLDTSQVCSHSADSVSQSAEGECFYLQYINTRGALFGNMCEKFNFVLRKEINGEDNPQNTAGSAVLSYIIPTLI